MQTKVAVQSRPVLEPFLAAAAGVRALPGVGSPVDHQMNILVETFPAELTGE